MLDQLELEKEGEWLDMWELRAHLSSLSHKGALRWLKKNVPPEYLGKRGNRRIVHIEGLRKGLEKCVWRPGSQPKGFQGCPGRKPPNVQCRDSHGRFVSHRSPSTPRPPKEGGWKCSRRNRYLVPPSNQGGQDE